MDESWINEFRVWASSTPLTFFKNSCYDYVRWQNKAVQYYTAARLLYFQELISPSMFCAFQSVENLMKATIMFYQGVSVAENFGHSLKSMEGVINNQIIKRISKKKIRAKILVPQYFVYESRFQTLSRYPRKGKGLGVGIFVLHDLDQLMLDLLEIVPFQFNTMLVSVLFRNSYIEQRTILEKENMCIQRMKDYLSSCINAETADETIYNLHRP